MDIDGLEYDSAFSVFCDFVIQETQEIPVKKKSCVYGNNVRKKVSYKFEMFTEPSMDKMTLHLTFVLEFFSKICKGRQINTRFVTCS